MAGPREQRRRRGAARGACVAAATLLASCHSLDNELRRLEQVHSSDESSERRTPGSSAQSALQGLVLDTHFASPGFLGLAPVVHRDPVGACFENAISLAHRRDSKPRQLDRKVEYLTWLLHECSSTVTLERCALELASLCPRLGVEAPLTIEPGADVAAPEQVSQALAGLQQGIGNRSPQEIQSACTALGALRLEHEGARRVLVATREALGAKAKDLPARDALQALHEEMLRRCLGLALHRALEAPQPLVRSAGLRAWAAASGGRSGEVLARGFADPNVEVVRTAAELLATGPIPPPPASSALDLETDAYWMEQLVLLLSQVPTGQASVAACKALSRLSGRPHDLHAEAWLHWWAERSSPDPSSPTPAP